MHPSQSKSSIFEEIGEIWTVGVVSIGVARILSAGVHFFTTQQKLLKIDSCSENFFYRPRGVQVHPLHPPGYAYGGQFILFACVWSLGGRRR